MSEQDQNLQESGFTGSELAAELLAGNRYFEPLNANLAPEHLQAELENRFDTLMVEAHYAGPDPQLMAYQPESRPVNFGRCEVPVDMFSAKALQMLAELKNVNEGTGPGGKVNSREQVLKLAKEFTSGNYSAEQEGSAVEIGLDATPDGHARFGLSGGRHRLAAAIIAGKPTLEGNVMGADYHIDNPKVAELMKSLQIHNERSDNHRANFAQGNSRLITF